MSRALVFLSALAVAAAQECSNTLTVDYPEPVAADGWSYRLIANDLTDPRGLLFDNDGGLLVVDRGVGLVHMRLRDDGDTCLTVDEKTTLIADEDLNHGIALSEDGLTLYASSESNVYSWAYSSGGDAPSVEEDSRRTLVANMSNTDHTTRTLLLSRRQPGTLLVSRGSDSNQDADAEDIDSGHAQIRSFDIGSLDEDSDPVNYTDGNVIGWGLRNSVGVAEHNDGGLWSVENSVDELYRNGIDVHEDNPGEELNYHGRLGDDDDQGGNYGYPSCFAVWSTDNFPDLGDLEVGDQFPGEETTTLTDESCNDDFVDPELVFQAHTAPLDIKFTEDGTEAFISFHGSCTSPTPPFFRMTLNPQGTAKIPLATASPASSLTTVSLSPTRRAGMPPLMSSPTLTSPTALTTASARPVSHGTPRAASG